MNTENQTGWLPADSKPAKPKREALPEVSNEKLWYDGSIVELEKLTKDLKKLSRWLYEERGISSGWNTDPGGHSNEVSRPTERIAIANLKKHPSRAIGEKALREALAHLRRAAVSLDLSVEGSL